jgi:hypothetical protein
MPEAKQSIPSYGPIAGFFSTIRVVMPASSLLCPFLGRAATAGVTFSDGTFQRAITYPNDGVRA